MRPRLRLVLNGVVPFLALAAVTVNGQEPFVYDDHGRRDPLWPLVNSKGVIMNYETEFLITDLALEGIMVGTQGENLAIINGRVLKVGDSIGQFVVGRIGEDSIVINEGKQKYELKLKRGD